MLGPCQTPILGATRGRMRQYKFILTVTALSLAVMVVGCGLMDEPKAKNAPFGLITTPASYYSTSKARYLGDKYKANLDRLVERIVSNPKTASLQFANNIASVGGIGFFTHSAATTPDERYLEVVLAAPETFEASGEYSGKLNQLFASYGIELLSILASDADIYQEKDVSGYGLNLSWRKVVREPSGPRVSLERAVAYFSKQKVRAFLRQEVSQNDLLEVAVIFVVEEDGPMRLVTYRPVEPKPDFRAPIQEQTLADKTGKVGKPEIATKKVESAEAERIVALNPPSARPAPVTSGSEATHDQVNESKAPQPRAPARSPEVLVPEPTLSAPITKLEAPAVSPSSAVGALRPKEENVAETKPQDPVSVEAKTKEAPELDSPFNERTTKSKIIVSSVETKPPAVSPSAGSKGVGSNDVKASDAKFENHAMAREKQSKASEGPKPFAEKTPEQAQAVGVSPSPVTRGIPSKEEVGDAGAKSALAVKPDALKAQDQPKVAEDSAAQPSTVALKSEAKAAAVTQQSPSKVTSAREENRSKAEGPGTVTLKTEITKAPEPNASTQEKKLEPPVYVPKSEAKPVVTGEPASKVKPGAEESLSQAPSANSAVSKTETVKPDTVTSAGEKKLEPLVAAPKVETKAREATIQNEAAVAEKKPQFVSRPELIKEKQLAGTPSPVATAGVKAPTTIQAAEEPARAAQTPALDKPASEKAGVKALQGAPAPMQPAPAATGKVSEKPKNEQIALLTKRPEEVIQEKKSVSRPTPRALEGYIVQLSFSQRDEAQRWAEKLASQGYAVSMTETGNSAFRVRIGNFAVRSEAERRLKTLGQEGLKGIVLNLPQAYRPDSGRAAEATADAISLTP